jgi:hypothetical protein
LSVIFYCVFVRRFRRSCCTVENVEFVGDESKLGEALRFMAQLTNLTELSVIEAGGSPLDFTCAPAGAHSPRQALLPH